MIREIRERLFAAGLVFGSLGLGACSQPADMADALYFDCTVNPNSIARKEINLKPGQDFLLSGVTVRAVSAGRIVANPGDKARFVEFRGDSVVMVGFVSLLNLGPAPRFRLALSTPPSDETITRLEVTYKCQDPSNP